MKSLSLSGNCLISNLAQALSQAIKQSSEVVPIEETPSSRARSSTPTWQQPRSLDQVPTTEMFQNICFSAADTLIYSQWIRANVHTGAGTIPGIKNQEGKNNQYGDKYVSSIKMFTYTVGQGKLLRCQIPTLRAQMDVRLASIYSVSSIKFLNQ